MRVKVRVNLSSKGGEGEATRLCESGFMVNLELLQATSVTVRVPGMVS